MPAYTSADYGGIVTGEAMRVGSLGKTEIAETKFGFIKSIDVDEKFNSYNISISKQEDPAIGAGPVLIKNSEIMNTWRYECIPGDYDVNCANPDPRSAIGITADNRLVLFVCEGREKTEGVLGYSTENVAKVLKEFGCTDAINLDGGGSSCLLVNGFETIKPSDGKQRSVGSCIYIK